MTTRALLSTRRQVPLALSKFQRSAVPRLTVVRERLSALLAGSDWRLALMTGVTASGKTVAVTQWFETLDDVAREWATLDASDDAPDRFWPMVVAALDRAVPNAFANSVELAAEGQRRRTSFLEGLVFELLAVEGPIVLVLDDFHEVSDADVHSDLAWLIEHLPSNVRIVLISRADPKMPIARWRAQSWFLDIRQIDLALTLLETTALAEMLAEDCFSPSDVEHLWRHTEGWVGGLRIAITALRGDEDTTAGVLEFSGRHHMVADLLTTEILDKLPPPTQNFMLCTSVLDVLDADLCDVLTGRHDSAEVLRELEDSLPFLSVAAFDRSGYRYHPLLREVLRNELDQRDPRGLPALHRAAADLFEARGELFTAVRHLISAGEIDRAFALAFVNTCDRYDHSDPSAARAWISLFDPQLVAGTASRMLTIACALEVAGSASEAAGWLDRAAGRLAEDPAPKEQDVAMLDALRLVGYTVAASGDMLPGERAIEAIDRGIDLGLPGARARPNLARANLLLDHTEDARRVLGGGPVGDEIARLLLAPAVGARIALRQGGLVEAEHEAMRAITASRILGVEAHIGAFDAHLAMAGVLVDRNDIVGATALLALIDERIQQFHPEALVYRVLLRVEQARIAVSQGGPEEGLAIVDQMRSIMKSREHAAIDRIIDAVETRWCIDAGDLDQAKHLISKLASGSPRAVLLGARLDVAEERSDAARILLNNTAFINTRDQLTSELLLARATDQTDSISIGDHLEKAVKLAVNEGFVKIFLEEGATVVRQARTAAEAMGSAAGIALATALGAPPQVRHIPTAPFSLSDREQAVFRFLPTRLSNREIARECIISVNTVKAHLKSIYSKLGVSSRSEAVERARSLGLL